MPDYVVSVASGAVPIYGGRSAPPPPPIAVLVGDSLTDPVGYNLSPAYLMNGLAGGVLKIIANIGVQGETVQQVLARIDNLYTASSPGLAGLPTRPGWVFLQIGTNNARSQAIDNPTRAAYAALYAKLLTYADFVFVGSLPALGGAEAAANANVQGYNAYQQGLCASSGGKLIWNDYSAVLKDGAGAARPEFYNPDLVHTNNNGVWAQSQAGSPTVSAALAPCNYPSPLSTSAADVYPAQPQWVPNHTNIGTGGSAGGGASGVVPTGMSVWGNGGGIAVSCSKVTAEVGDPNQAPWLRLTPTQVTATGGGESIQLTALLNGRTVTGIDPERLEIVLQIRLNGLDGSKISQCTSWVQAPSGAKVVGDLPTRFGAGVLTQTLVMRHALPRPSAASAASLTLYNELRIAANGTGPMGSIDFRYETIKG